MFFRYKHGDRPLDGYTIQRGVGTGGFGEVYFALSDGGRQVALKYLQNNPEIELRGVGQCMNLKSPYLVTIFDVRTSEDGTSFVIMEYVAGTSLRDLLRECPAGMGPAKAAWFLREIARGLGYLHERGIVHRDLKPENLFFEDGYVKIGDYGLSKYISVSRQSCQSISVGTVHYMAPEIGSGRYHRGIDLYALGVILHELVTGRVPFTGDSFGEILMKHLSVEPDLTGIPAPFDAVIRKALRKNPDERYAKVEEMVQDLLGSPAVDALLRDFRPETISRPGPHPEALLETMVLPPPIDRNGQGPRRTPPPIPQADPVAAGAGPQAAIATPIPRGPAWSPERLFTPERVQKGFQAVMTSAAMAVVATLVSQQGTNELAFGSFFLILSGAFAAIVSEREAPGRLSLEPGIPRRLFLLCIAAPLYLIFCYNFFGPYAKETTIALLIATAVLHWDERVLPSRPQRISLGKAFTAGLVGFIAGIICIQRGDSALVVASIMAAMSLVVNVKAAFAPRPSSRKRETRDRPVLSPGPGPAPSPALAPAAAAGLASAASAAPRAGHAVPQVPSGRSGDRPMPIWGRVLALAIAAVLLATSLTLFIMIPLTFLHGGGQPPAAIAGMVCAVFSLFSLRVGLARKWWGFWQFARWFLISACISTAGGSGAVMLLDPPRRDDELAICIAVIIFSLVIGLFLGLLPRMIHRMEKGRTPDDPEPPGASPGWTSLGVLLVILGISVELGSALLAGPLGRSVLNGMGPLSNDIRHFISGGMHLLVSCALFIPGIFCFLRGRQSQGGAHVLRGALGFSGAACLVYFLSKGIFLVFNSFLGIFSALLLFWPARATRIRVE